MVQVTVVYTPFSEAVRIAHVLEGIYNNFYLNNNWYVIEPNCDLNPNYSTVFLPNLNYKDYDIEKILQFSTKENFLFKEVDIIKPIEKDLIAKNYFIEISNQQLKKLEKTYIKIANTTLAKAENCINYLKNKNFIINIYLTNFGTCGSFTSTTQKNLNKKNISIDIFIRADQKPQTLIELLISSVTRSKVSGTWQQTEAVSDYLTKNIFNYKSHYSTLHKTKKIKPKLLEQSIKYLQNLTLPTGKILEAIDNRILFLGTDITNKFSTYEKRALRLLIEKQNTTVTFDNISEAMYKTNAEIKFTLWGITKTIQRIRDKLQKLGLPRNTIINVKGEGFILTEQ